MRYADIAQRRLFQQRLAQPDVATPGEVVRWFGAVQAQEYASSLYGVGLRMPNATERIVEQAIAAKTIVRTWPMRGTIHYTPPEDTRWMLKLMARRTNLKAASIYRRAGLSEDLFARAGDALTRALQGGKTLSRKQLYAALEAADIATDGASRGLHLLGYWAREGLICLGPRQGRQPTFTLLDEWLPPAPPLEGDEALAVLARRYFTSHGPATERDFSWWTGLTLAEVRQGMRLVAQDFARETVDGAQYWLSQTPAPEPLSGSHALLLPPYDEFTVAYKDRLAILDPAFPADPFTILGPVIAVDGRLVGSWKRTLTKDAVTLTFTLFASLSGEREGALAQAAERYGRFLGLPVVIETRAAGA